MPTGRHKVVPYTDALHKIGLNISRHRRHQSGRISLEADGTVDPVKADAAWTRSTGPGEINANSKIASAKLRPIPEAAVGSVRETLKEQGLPAGGSVTFVQARTAHEIAKAHLARLRLQRMKNELIDRARTTAMVFRSAREERDTWINWPARVAALMASELGIEAPAMQKALETHARSQLTKLAEFKPDFR